MNKFIYAVLAVIVAITGCSNDNRFSGDSTATHGKLLANQKKKTHPFKNISPVEAKKMMDSRKDLLVIDVRTPGELREGYIADSRLIPVQNMIKGKHDIPKNRGIIIYCAVGGRSFAASKYLKRKGYKEIYNMKGGITSWKKAGLPVKY